MKSDRGSSKGGDGVFRYRRLC